METNLQYHLGVCWSTSEGNIIAVRNIMSCKLILYLESNFYYYSMSCKNLVIDAHAKFEHHPQIESRVNHRSISQTQLEFRLFFSNDVASLRFETK